MPATQADTASTGAPRRRLIAIVALLAAALLAYAAWPLATAAGLLRAARHGDAAAIEARVDFPRLRRSIARQIVAEAVRLRPLQGPERQLALGAGTAALAAWLDELLTPRILADLLGGRRIAAAPATAPIDLSMIQAAPLRSLLEIWWRSGFAGPMRYEIAVPRPDAQDPILVTMELRGLSWRVSGFALPDDVKENLARRVTNLASPRQAPQP